MMSKHDYTKHSNKSFNKDANRPAPEIKTSIVDMKPSPVVDPEPVVELVETMTLPTGRVIDCVKLNVREYPETTANILCEIPCGSKVTVDTDSSTRDFYKVYNEHGIEGYCMKKYIVVEP
jgi:uncharacterized protein YgiM (DUF1202 family)